MLRQLVSSAVPNRISGSVVIQPNASPMPAEYARLAREAEGRQMRSALYEMSRTWETMAKFAAQVEALGAVGA